jgi:SAM-dependent methyltransferase
MSTIDGVHSAYVHNRRVEMPRSHLSAIIPSNSSVLDVGCGDGLLARRIKDTRPDIQIEGVDVLIRSATWILVAPFDGCKLPCPDSSFDVVMFVDVLHHTDEPRILLSEAKRISKKFILIKIHTEEGLLAHSTLRFMDWVGNAKHGVSLPYNYWRESKWKEALTDLRLSINSWISRLRLYPLPFDWIFGRSLHFIALFEKRTKSSAETSNRHA